MVWYCHCQCKNDPLLVMILLVLMLCSSMIFALFQEHTIKFKTNLQYESLNYVGMFTLTSPLYCCVDMNTSQWTYHSWTLHFCWSSWKCFVRQVGMYPAAMSSTDGCFNSRWGNKAGQCQLGSRCLKHQFLAADYKVVLDGFIMDSLCQ